MSAQIHKLMVTGFLVSYKFHVMVTYVALYHATGMKNLPTLSESKHYLREKTRNKTIDWRIRDISLVWIR